MDTPTANSTRDQLLSHAQKLIRSRGCNGFSYRDLADYVGVKTSSIHYYFPCKDDLLLEALESYSSRALASLRNIDATLAPRERLDRYFEKIEAQLCAGDELCLGGMLAAEIISLPESVRQALQGFFRGQEQWLMGVLRDGRADGSIVFHGDIETAARALFAAVQGLMITARLFREPARLKETLSDRLACIV
ncbi:TetR/AcrR family transcriptional regulator [Bordetella avium]|uniref:TetR-family transcriptional regulator n=1 Tax=Bordetella avium (strain 197N) TaxID=360910 RepID=Q2KWE6_BORA1|nr:TetR/AcrR family transcriptional regulator [Bordetella avium]AZY48361.1 TetR/AcrR family transcriptional regulator [Bordetella avium]AZY51741.1 TetR/AcrR family transcriptional regulator [Bordetella avium]RIQ13397.1 TetR/AcrR family transcriptional regulator [Bordetella avium]RIQ15966.1 TetR/AcrR family transcriptional regulator [Bordetella avium]RIQ30167.1 TetR/AcrR family transcriptional regulator [Bordetella avium]